MIKCPKCGADAPDFKTREGVEMNYCGRGCKGVWFDQGELALYCETATNVADFATRLGEGQRTDYDCPRCDDAKLIELPYLPGEEVMVDGCESCQGVFLDAKELAKVQDLANRHEKQADRLKRAAEQLAEAGYSSGLRGTKV